MLWYSLYECSHCSNMTLIKSHNDEPGFSLKFYSVLLRLSFLFKIFFYLCIWETKREKESCHPLVHSQNTYKKWRLGQVEVGSQKLSLSLPCGDIVGTKLLECSPAPLRVHNSRKLESGPEPILEIRHLDADAGIPGGFLTTVPNALPKATFLICNAVPTSQGC